MQLPYPGPGQEPPYNEGNQGPPYPNQWQGYPQEGQQQYPPMYQNPPPARGPYGAAQGGNQNYYPPYQPDYGQPSPSYGQNTYGQQQYPPQQYGQQQYPLQQYNQQYQAPAQGPYGAPGPANVTPHYPPPQGGDANEEYAPPEGPPPTRPPQTEEERGILGAIAGGAAGGYAGHKLHHGFLGTLGGAYAGHKLEEAYKEHHKKPASPAPPIPPPEPRPSYNNYGGGEPLRGNFSASAVNITLDRDYDLIAECGAIDGHKKLSSISLNNVLTNDNGHFRWVPSGGNFGASARDVRLVDGGRVLEAELADVGGNWRRDRIMLDERIENSDGNLQMLS